MFMKFYIECNIIYTYIYIYNDDSFLFQLLKASVTYFALLKTFKEIAEQ